MGLTVGAVAIFITALVGCGGDFVVRVNESAHVRPLS
jgi:hypothetical protein